MKIKISYVGAPDLEQLQEAVSKELEALQLNVKNKVAEVKTIKDDSGYLAQIAYMELDGMEQQILMEGDTTNVSKNWYRSIYKC